MSDRSTVLALALVFAVALGLRLAYVEVTQVDGPLRADAGQYASYAVNLLQHGTFSRESPEVGAAPRADAFRSPGYPVLLAAVLWGWGEEGFYRAALRLQALLGALLVPLTFGLGRSFLSRPAALAVCAGVALSPHLVSLTGYLLTETLFACWLASSLLAFDRALSRRRPADWAAAGGLAGCAALTNQVAAGLPLAWGAVALARSWRIPGRAERVRGLAIFALVFALLPAAWALRGAFSLEPGARRGLHRALATLTHGAYPGWVHRDPRYRYYAYREDPESARMGRSLADFAQVMAGRVAAEPGRYLRWYLIEKPAVLWTWDILQGQGDVYVYPVLRSLYRESTLAESTRVLMRVLHPLVLVAAVAGLPLFAQRRWRGPSTSPVPALLLSTGLYVTAVYAVFAPWPRYAVPLRPQLYLWAAWSAAALGSAISAARASARTDRPA